MTDDELVEYYFEDLRGYQETEDFLEKRNPFDMNALRVILTWPINREGEVR